MVALRTFQPFSGENYWHISVQDHDDSLRKIRKTLHEKGFAFKKTSPKDRLIYLLTRAQRGMMCYDKCPVKELKRFCDARKIKRFNRDSKAVLIKRLESEDEEGMTFARSKDNDEPLLFRLPPELRRKIYKNCADALADPELQQQVSEPALMHNKPLPSPPIAKACRQLREEFLIIWNRRFVLKIQHSPLDVHPDPFALWTPIALSDAKMRTFFDEAPLGALAPIRQFDISSIMCMDYPNYWIQTHWKIILPIGYHGMKVLCYSVWCAGSVIQFSTTKGAIIVETIGNCLWYALSNTTSDLQNSPIREDIRALPSALDKAERLLRHRLLRG